MIKFLNELDLMSSLEACSFPDFEGWYWENSNLDLPKKFFTSYSFLEFSEEDKLKSYSCLIDRYEVILQKLSSAFSNCGLNNWIVCHEVLGRKWNSSKTDSEFQLLLSKAFARWGKGEDETGGFQVNAESLSELLSLLLFYPWRCSYLNLRFYSCDAKLMLLLDHHGTIYFTSIRKSNITQINMQLTDLGIPNTFLPWQQD